MRPNVAKRANSLACFILRLAGFLGAETEGLGFPPTAGIFFVILLFARFLFSGFEELSA